MRNLIITKIIKFTEKKLLIGDDVFNGANFSNYVSVFDIKCLNISSFIYYSIDKSGSFVDEKSLNYKFNLDEKYISDHSNKQNFINFKTAILSLLKSITDNPQKFEAEYTVKVEENTTGSEIKYPSHISYLMEILKLNKNIHVLDIEKDKNKINNVKKIFGKFKHFYAKLFPINRNIKIIMDNIHKLMQSNIELNNETKNKFKEIIELKNHKNTTLEFGNNKIFEKMLITLKNLDDKNKEILKNISEKYISCAEHANKINKTDSNDILKITNPENSYDIYFYINNIYTEYKNQSENYASINDFTNKMKLYLENKNPLDIKDMMKKYYSVLIDIAIYSIENSKFIFENKHKYNGNVESCHVLSPGDVLTSIDHSEMIYDIKFESAYNHADRNKNLINDGSYSIVYKIMSGNIDTIENKLMRQNDILLENADNLSENAGNIISTNINQFNFNYSYIIKFINGIFAYEIIDKINDAKFKNMIKYSLVISINNERCITDETNIAINNNGAKTLLNFIMIDKKNSNIFEYNCSYLIGLLYATSTFFANKHRELINEGKDQTKKLRLHYFNPNACWPASFEDSRFDSLRNINVYKFQYNS